MKRISLGIGAGILVLALAGASGAHALWSERQTIIAGRTTTGSFAVTAAWVATAPSWSPLFPGGRTPDATIRVAQSGDGTTLGWRIRMSSTVNPAFSPYITFQAWAGACGTGTPIPAGGYPVTGHLSQGTSLDVCVRYTLSASAPGSLQGTPLNPQITVSGHQAGG